MTRYDIWDHHKFGEIDCIRISSILISSHVLSDGFSQENRSRSKCQWWLYDKNGGNIYVAINESGSWCPEKTQCPSRFKVCCVTVDVQEACSASEILISWYTLTRLKCESGAIHFESTCPGHARRRAASAVLRTRGQQFRHGAAQDHQIDREQNIGTAHRNVQHVQSRPVLRKRLSRWEHQRCDIRRGGEGSPAENIASGLEAAVLRIGDFHISLI